MINVAIFASGNGSNAENIINYFESNDHISIGLVVSNKQDAYVHTRAKNRGIPSVFFPKSDFIDGLNILDYLHKYQIDFVVLAGFLLKIPTSIIKAYPNKIINIHPALLPKYGGKGMYGNNVHMAVVAANEKESGITIHYVDENYDEGNIIFQVKCLVSSTDTYEDVANKIHKLEYRYFPQIIESTITQQR